jgi:hypothetical protein
MTTTNKSIKSYALDFVGFFLVLSVVSFVFHGSQSLTANEVVTNLAITSGYIVGKGLLKKLFKVNL